MLNLPATGSIYAKPVKKCLEAKQGYIWYMVDLNALEDHVIANLSKDKNKCAVFLEDNLDGHCLNSYYYFKDEIEKLLPRNEGEELYDFIRRYKAEIDNGNKALKKIRQKSKSITFGLSYGAYPPKVAKSIKCSLEEAERIFNKYHKELYPSVDAMREKVLKKVTDNGKIHLGLGCHIRTKEPEKDIRSVFNACSQFWSILTLLTVNKMNTLIEEKGYGNKIQICCTIYDSIYLHICDDSAIIKWVNDTIIPLITKDFLKDTIVHNSAEGDIGYNWYDTITLSNNATIKEIEAARKEAYKKLID